MAKTPSPKGKDEHGEKLPAQADSEPSQHAPPPSPQLAATKSCSNSSSWCQGTEADRRGHDQGGRGCGDQAVFNGSVEDRSEKSVSLRCPSVPVRSAGLSPPAADGDG